MRSHPLKRLTYACALLVAFGLSACSFVATPPAELLARKDHVGLAAWYEQEAASLREKAAEMRRMAEQYANPSFQPGPKETKAELIAHCELFFKYYTQAAEEAETLAKSHRELIP